MPRRKKEDFKEHNGKFTYVSANFQKEWELKDNNLEVKSQVELDQGHVEIKTEIPIEGEIADYTSEDMKNARRERILKAHPDRGGSEEELKKVLDEEG